MAYTTIDDPSAHFQTKTYTGTSGIHNVTLDGNSDMQPDWVWFKNRDVGYVHQLYDSRRGVTKALYSNGTNAEATISNGLTQFQSDGFRVTSAAAVNEDSIVCWNWKANGGTTTSKSSGTVAGNVTTPCVQQVNTDAGFSIITYTASSSYAGTETHLEHGLGVGPRFLIVKRRDTAANWAVYHAENGASSNAGYGYLSLNSTAATATSSTYWLNTPAESNATLLAFGNNAATGADGGEYVCYAFAEKQGYSKFGGYVGNGNASGPFVYTGFKPAWVMIKPATAVEQWVIIDGTRSPSNQAMKQLKADDSAAEYNGASVTNGIDILSNGFKVRTSRTEINTSGVKYIYMAFAENPFVTSTGIPTTAR